MMVTVRVRLLTQTTRTETEILKNHYDYHNDSGCDIPEMSVLFKITARYLESN